MRMQSGFSVVAGSLFGFGVLMAAAPAGADEPYRLPPKAIADILDAPPLPSVSVSPSGQFLLLTHKRSMPGIDELAVPMLKLAGARVNPKTRGPYATYLSQGTGFTLVRLSDGQSSPVEIPQGKYGDPSWSPDGRSFIFLRTFPDHIELWGADVEQKKARRLSDAKINAAGARGVPCVWMSDSRRVLCNFVPANEGKAPGDDGVPTGPSIQETVKSEAPVWTFTNLLQTPHDEQLYEYFMTSQPMFVDVTSGQTQAFGPAAIYQTLEPSPNGQYFLSIRTVKPYSYLMPGERFPREVEILDARGQKVHELARLPLDTSGVSMGWAFDGPRNYEWQEGAAATLIYTESLDGGNPKQAAKHRDRLLKLDAPFKGAPVELLRTESRIENPPKYGANGLALVTETDWPTRRERTWAINVNRPGKPALVFDQVTDDWYANPGTPVVTTNARGERLILQDGDWIYLIGPGGSPEGDRPFLDRFNLKSRKSERLFRSQGESYENIVTVLDNKAQRIVTTYETQKLPPNYYLRTLKSSERKALTSFAHPAPQLADIQKQRIEYQRSDGVPLTGDLYLPVGYRKGQKVPAFVWAYPKEFASTQGAGQVRGSQYKFSWRLTGADHLLLLTQGYAVLNDASMPIVGGLNANDTFREQVAANGKAAVDKLVELGVTTPGHVGVGGHSYGAFMTANLLAHSDSFAAGIARSGAFNRSLTPFGFQRERRTFWEAPEVYYNMSAFMHADKVNEPLLLIHGDIDSNMGTFPIQSQRMYHAIKGLGGTARLVMLPYEDHGYAARESNLHVMYEMVSWLDRYVKKEMGTEAQANAAQ